jgi:molybdopterin converting factor subunit 1
MLKIKLFAKARDLAGSPEIQIPWSNGGTVTTLKQKLIEAYPALTPLAPRLLIAVNNDYANESAAICESDEVACFPPVSGG